jgi:hypothetical protein
VVTAGAGTEVAAGAEVAAGVSLLAAAGGLVLLLLLGLLVTPPLVAVAMMMIRTITPRMLRLMFRVRWDFLGGFGDGPAFCCPG